MPTTSEWNKFRKLHAGKGLTMKQLGAMYQAQNAKKPVAPVAAAKPSKPVLTLKWVWNEDDVKGSKKLTINSVEIAKIAADLVYGILNTASVIEFIDIILLQGKAKLEHFGKGNPYVMKLDDDISLNYGELRPEQVFEDGTVNDVARAVAEVFNAVTTSN